MLFGSSGNFNRMLFSQDFLKTAGPVMASIRHQQYLPTKHSRLLRIPMLFLSNSNMALSLGKPKEFFGILSILVGTTPRQQIS